MGVRIMAYSRLALTEPHERWTGACQGDHLFTFAYRGLEHSTRGLADHDQPFDLNGTPCVGGRCYALTAATGKHEILDMAYGGYNRWRELLASAVLEVDPGTIWAHPDPWRDRPFYELINFADNEGSIGPDAAKDLLADFQVPEHRAAYERALAGSDGERWIRHVWDSWVTGLTLAADEGLVRFA